MEIIIFKILLFYNLIMEIIDLVYSEVNDNILRLYDILRHHL